MRRISRTENGGRIVEDGELRLGKGDLRYRDEEWIIENLELRMESCGLRMDNQYLRIPLCHAKFQYTFL